MWKKEPAAYKLKLSCNEITTDEFRLIFRMWNYGYACQVMIKNRWSKKKHYNQWFYDFASGFDCGPVAHEIACLATGDVKGMAADSFVNSVFKYLLEHSSEFKQKFTEYFPETAKQFEATKKMMQNLHNEYNGIVINGGLGI